MLVLGITFPIISQAQLKYELVHHDYDFVGKGTGFEICYKILPEKYREVEVVNVYISNDFEGDMSIPKKVSYKETFYKVTKIGDKAFSTDLKIRSYLTNVTLPESITAIGNSAFEDCWALTNMTLPESIITIGERAFKECAGWDTKLTIPNSMTKIGKETFYGCNSLTNVTLPNSLTTIGEGAFYGCNSLTSLNIPNSVNTIEKRAFYNCYNLTSLDIPNSVTIIEDETFYNCKNLTDVTLPNSLTTIGERAFSNCANLTSLNIPNSVTKIGNEAFSNCSSLISVDLNNSETTIEEDTFFGCNRFTVINVQQDNLKYGSIEGVLYKKNVEGNLSELTLCPKGKEGIFIIPTFVTEIGEYAFYGCVLSGVEIPASVTKIGNQAFSYCHNLTSIDIPASVKKLGSYAFYHSECIEKVYCHWEKPISSDDPFSYECLLNAKLYVPIGTKSNYENSRTWGDFCNIIEGDYEATSSIYDILESNRSIHEEIERFDINGQLVSKDYKGLVIIRNSDGTTRKMIVK